MSFSGKRTFNLVRKQNRDCNSIKEILKYTGSVHQLRHWSHELFEYDCSIVNRSANTMKGVDAFSRNINPLIHQYLFTTSIIHGDDLRARLSPMTTMYFIAVPTHVM